ncbi:SAF domain-containing protein [Helicobacter sp. 11S03491-1]|uniref:SAF domain-containing protein n=1 Tax=Helicobacter sp. 11S03491-1 TaxID=1476196 RepID=UPI000BA7BF8F|nr:SAF domain-containing protein [Helicobacter sp. 11S03491-1]PAF43372.1 hypothetical protein BKH45_01660 [Helicobacter sp. 11S03491-1]
MNRKIMILISIMILLVSVLGLFITQGESSNSTKQDNIEPSKQTFSLLSATKNLHAGEIINPTDIATQTIEDKEDKIWGDKIVDKNKDFILDSILLRDIPKGEIITYSDIARPGSKEYDQLKASPRKSLFSFGFDLNQREYVVLQKLKPNEFVDIYFKYETKNPKNIPVLPKQSQNQQYSSQENANSTNLVLVFPHKRVLFLEKKSSQEKSDLQNLQKTPQIMAHLYAELSQEDIKKVYTIEDLGYFFILPSSQTSQKSQNFLATDDVLTKDFIKELKGGIDAKNDSF